MFDKYDKLPNGVIEVTTGPDDTLTYWIKTFIIASFQNLVLKIKSYL
jgi:hypothetical protein